MERQRERDLAGKVAIITGASRGIGMRTATMLADRGVKVVVSARTVDPGYILPGTVGETVAQIEANGGEALGVAADMSKEEDLANLVSTTIDHFGGVDILVNNAGVTMIDSFSSPLLEIPMEDWLYQYAVNVHAPFSLIRHVLPSMQARGGGRILNVTTGSAEMLRVPEEPSKIAAEGDFSLLAPAYYSSKRALDRMSNVIAAELRQKNVWIISMCPGLAHSAAVQYQIDNGGLSTEHLVPLEVPGRVLCYFAACEDPAEYTGRIFLAERELAELGLTYA